MRRSRHRNRKDNEHILGLRMVGVYFVFCVWPLRSILHSFSLEDNSWKMFSLNDCFNYKLGLGKPEVRNRN